ncbi:hypothetical protein DICA2_F05336 [Diutina catenulata]
MPRRTKGCRTCKKLKIGCDSRRPSCGYCLSTNRQCEYADPLPSAPSPATKASPGESELISPEEAASFSSFTLHIPSQYLSMTPMEVQVADFYHQFIKEYFDRSSAQHNISAFWSRAILEMTNSSVLVRRSLLAYSALLIHKFAPSIQFCDSKEFTQLYVVMQNNFQSTISTINQIISQASQSPDFVAKVGQHLELVFSVLVSGLLVFMFLCRHPHKLMPLVAFVDEENESTLHFLGIARGLIETLIMWAPCFYMSPFRNIYVEIIAIEPPSRVDPLPLLSPLVNDLADAYIPPTTRNTLSQTLQALNACTHQLTQSGFHLDLCKFFLLADAPFFDLVNQKNFFALRIMYIYSCFSLFIDFIVSEDSNMWSDYMEWYRRYNMKIYDKWMYTFDEKIYQVALVHRLRFRFSDYSELQQLSIDGLVELAKSQPRRSRSVTRSPRSLHSQAENICI